MTPSDIKIPREVVEKVMDKMSYVLRYIDDPYEKRETHLKEALALLAPYLEKKE